MKEDSAVPGLVAPTLRVHVWRIKTWQSPQDVVLNQSTKCWNAAWPHTGSFQPWQRMRSGQAQESARKRAHCYASQLQVRACMHASAAIARCISSGSRPRSIQVTEARQGKGQNCCRGGEES